MRLKIGTVAGPVGLKGHVRLKVVTDDPGGRFAPGEVVLTDDGELTIGEARTDGRSVQVAFEGHESRDAAEALRDTQLYIETDAEEMEADEFFYHELVGLPAVHVDGDRLGEVAGVVAMPGHDLIEVSTAAGRVLVPFVEQIVVEVRDDAVVIDPPGGLFDDESEDERA